MSAIWGAVNLGGFEIENKISEVMEKPMHGCKIDKYAKIVHNNAFFACGLQYITKESKNEILPYFDEQNQVIFTADCMIDNRSALIREIDAASATQQCNLPVLPGEELGDGMLVYLAWLIWREKVCDHLLGVFSFAVYEFESDTVWIYADHTGARCITYYLNDQTVFFSTVYEPIIHANIKEIELSEKWIAACEASMSPNMTLFPGLTPYKGMYQILAGDYVRIELNNAGKVKVKVIEYWNPIKSVHSLKKMSDQDYKGLFLSTFRNCVEDVLRADGETGIMLSSGLDSSSVACVAAKRLGKKNRKLYSYTSVPLPGYQEKKDTTNIENESMLVQKLAEVYPEFVPSFCAAEGKSVLTEMDHLVDMTGLPGKNFINMVWIDEVYEKASENGCRIMLNGQNGNSTISYGSYLDRLYQECRAFHFGEAYRQYHVLARKFHVIHKVLMQQIRDNLRSNYFPETGIRDTCVRKELIRRYHLQYHFKKMISQTGGNGMDSKAQKKHYMFLKNAFQQMAFSYIRSDLYHGVVTRDPTRDKRIIELCMAMPIKCFADKGIDRRLVREYLKDIVPDFIIKNYLKRGLQSADLEYRLRCYSGEKCDIELLDPQIYHYVDHKCVESVFGNKMIYEEDYDHILLRLQVMTLSCFLKKWKETKKDC
jgi:asparagine synthase (glutamine-hydrolysing)